MECSRRELPAHGDRGPIRPLISRSRRWWGFARGEERALLERLGGAVVRPPSTAPHGSSGSHSSSSFVTVLQFRAVAFTPSLRSISALVSFERAMPSP